MKLYLLYLLITAIAVMAHAIIWLVPSVARFHIAAFLTHRRLRREPASDPSSPRAGGRG